MKCIICEQRKAKRYCPAKRTYICSVCCGEKRGVEIDCPLDCPYFVEGQSYQQTKVTRQRVKKEGVQSYIRRAELYNRNPELFAQIETVLVDFFRRYNIKDEDLTTALDLVVKTLDTEKKGIFYEHKAELKIVNELSGQLLAVIRAFKDRAEVGQGRISIDYAIEVFQEFLKEVKFYREIETNPQTYLIHISRYHPDKAVESQSSGGLIITP